MFTQILMAISRETLRANRDAMATKSDFAHLRSELQILEKADFSVLKSDIQLLEKKLETGIANIYTELERVENRIVKWVIATAMTTIALSLGFIRLLTPSSPSPKEERPKKQKQLERPPTEFHTEATNSNHSTIPQGQLPSEH